VPPLLAGGPGGLDEFPEARIALQRFILAGLEALTVEKILQRVATEDAMNEHAEVVLLEIDPVIAEAQAVQDVAIAFQFAEVLQFRGHHLLRHAPEIAEDLQLEILGHPREFGGGGGREDDLKG
jgi:hypothetical protein